ncbi:uncharacterized protein BP5553_02586 [Venustampulla echinocandica]|uniref:WD40 repeat-like protein n=1 Tax=Venustampulla echinocandica TaxID=2656787 RepID=A0A370TRT7_9HELO|nr:uncharacterized protein BP5553_02586 [Venustampulla echinocandica]RDL38246.1 hypothetical protein BP5553_02586 [Venustampulla echinocandica]
MDRPPLDIPGYYYDKEKKKYFKIQSGSPASAAYSSQDVKRRKTRDEKTEATAFAIARQKGRIHRPKLLREPLTGGILAREQGQGTLRAPDACARGLVAQGSVPLVTFEDPMFAINHRPDLGPSRLNIRVANNYGIVTLKANANEHTSSTETSLNICRDLTFHEVNSPRFPSHMFGYPGTPTSMSTHHASGRVAVTWLAGTPDCGIIIAPQPDNYVLEWTDILLGPGISRGPEVSVYSSVAGNSSSDFLFAYGTSHGIMFTDIRTLNTRWVTPIPTADNHCPKDIFALDVPADNPWALLAGGRKGHLYMKDRRIQSIHQFTDVIEHRSSITHIKQLDPHRVLVAGLNSSLCQYDLRFCKKSPQAAPPSGKHLKSFSNSTPTNPILQYLDYFNTATIQSGFDVDLETGVVAAAQEWDELHAPVQLFSLHGGHALHSPQIAKYLPPGENVHGGHVKCLRFARDGENRMKSLYVGYGHDIRRFAWAEKEE